MRWRGFIVSRSLRNDRREGGKKNREGKAEKRLYLGVRANVKEQKERIEMMECRIKELEGENGFLKELVMGRIKWKEERENEEGNSEEEKKDKDDGKTE